MPFKCVSADKIYQKDPNLKKQDVEEIQKWLKTQPHLPKVEGMFKLLLSLEVFSTPL